MEDQEELRVRVVDVDIRFWSLVKLLVKISLASIPAVIILTIIVSFAGALIGGLKLPLAAP